MKAPFPWFGGKRRVAPLIWQAFGDVDNYVEPFAGSLAVLLERPTTHRARAETVNDADQFLANFWRAVTADPDAVAHHADWPVNEADLFARHMWLVNTGRERLANMDTDPEWYDAKVAGWWVWGICAWIGSGWCSGTGPHKPDTLGDAGMGVKRQLPHLSDAGRGVNRKLPHLGNAGRGVNRQLPHLGNAGRGVNRKLPHLGNAGRGVNRQLPHLGNAGRGVNRQLPHLGNVGQGAYEYFRVLADRLRNVRVCCGDWTRVVTTGALNYGATAGVLLDPPYLGDVRTSDLYAVDDHTIAHDVREWAIANGDNPRLRIALCGYEPEHIDHMPPAWRMHAYSASKSYGSAAGGGVNDANRALERIWFSPHCLSAESQGSLFGDAA